MWTAWNDCIQRPQIWDILHDRDRAITSAVWFPLHSKGSGADYICTPAPVHNADGSESPWCFTRPEGLYDELKTKHGHFPLQHFWGPLAGIQSTTWIVDSAILTAEKYKPNFFYLYLPHLDYAAQKNGPDSKAAHQAVADLDTELGKLIAGFEKAYSEAPLWLAASEYVISRVNDVTYPNRILREAGLLKVSEAEDGEHLDFTTSKAWALADHQFSHVFVQDSDPKMIKKVARLFAKQPGIAEVLTGEDLAKYHTRPPPHAATSCSSPTRTVGKPTTGGRTMPRPRSTPAPSISTASPATIPSNSSSTPARRPSRSTPTLFTARTAPAKDPSQRGVLLTSEPGVFLGGQLADTQVAELVLKQFADE